MNLRRGLVRWALGMAIASCGAAPVIRFATAATAAQDSQSRVHFEEVAEARGIHFRHFDPVTDNQYISETIGSGAGWIDFDGDTQPDLVLLNSAALPGSKEPNDGAPRSRFFRNRFGSFEDVTDHIWRSDPGFGQGVAAGDLDNDGFDDLYVTYYLGVNRLYHNNGDGTFSDVTERAGVGCPLWSTSAAMGDLDRDGDLDMYVCNYLDMPLDQYPYCGDPQKMIRTVCSPAKFAAQPDMVYENLGDGEFSEVSEAWGFRSVLGRALGVVISDLDSDGWPDVFVANDLSPNFLFRNLGSGKFEEQGLLSGCAVSADGQVQAGMGVDAGDVDGDGRFDLIVTNFFREPNSLFRNDGGLLFREISARAGIARPSMLHLGFGCGFIDANNDGALDLFIANGHIDRNPELHGFPEPYRQRQQFFLGNGRARFEELEMKGYFAERRVGRAAAFADFDSDGRMDIAVNHNGEPAALLLNQTPQAGAWLRVHLVGTSSNRSAVGTRVIVTIGDTRLTRELTGGRSYLSSHDLRMLVGTGAHERVDRLEIVWPNGNIQAFEDLTARTTIHVRELVAPN